MRAETGELPQHAAVAACRRSTASPPTTPQVLTAKGRPTVAYFEAVAKAVGDGKAAANRMSDLVFPALAERKLEIEAFPVVGRAVRGVPQGNRPLEQAGPRRIDEVHARPQRRCPCRDGQDRPQAADVRRGDPAGEGR